MDVPAKSDQIEGPDSTKQGDPRKIVLFIDLDAFEARMELYPPAKLDSLVTRAVLDPNSNDSRRTQRAKSHTA